MQFVYFYGSVYFLNLFVHVDNVLQVIFKCIVNYKIYSNCMTAKTNELKLAKVISIFKSGNQQLIR